MRQIPLLSLQRRRAGFTAITGALLAIPLIGMLGFAVDIGRMYINKNETQNFVDAASLLAALELDGTVAGVARARSAVLTGGNRWNFNTEAFSNPAVEFSNTGTGNWEANPASPAGFRFARVSATVNVPIYFTRIVNGITQVDVSSSSMAGQAPTTVYREGVMPFSPLAHDASDTQHFGLVKGGIYTLRWSANPTLPNGNGKKGSSSDATGTVGSKPVFANNVCYGDAVSTYGASSTTDSYTNNFINKAEAGGGSERGYIEETSSAIIRKAIEADYQTYSLTIGSTVNMTGGAKNTQGASLQNRVAQDTNATGERYADYVAAGNGNGRRIVLVPVNTYHPDYEVVGFRAFFLLPGSYYNGGGNEPFCAEYVGAYNRGSGHMGAGNPGAYTVRLME